MGIKIKLLCIQFLCTTVNLPFSLAFHELFEAPLYIKIHVIPSLTLKRDKEAVRKVPLPGFFSLVPLPGFFNGGELSHTFKGHPQGACCQYCFLDSDFVRVCFYILI